MKRKDVRPPLESAKDESPPLKKSKDYPVILTTLVSANEAREKSTELRGKLQEETDSIALRAAVNKLWPHIESQITKAIADGNPSCDLNVTKFTTRCFFDCALDICADKIKDLGYGWSVTGSFADTFIRVSWG